MKTMNTDPAWLKRMAELEDGSFVSVGGWVTALAEAEAPARMFQPTRSAFSRLVQLARRERNMTVERLAEESGIRLADLLRIEQDEHYTPTPRVVYRVAQCFSLPETELMALAGLLEVSDNEFSDAALKFAARSAPVQELTREEHAALQEFVRYLTHREKQVS